MSRSRQITWLKRLAAVNREAFYLVSVLPEVTMSVIQLANDPIFISLEHDDVIVETREDEFGGTENVFMIRQVRTTNATTNSYHLVVMRDGQAVYEDQIHAGREMLVSLEESKHFKSSLLGYSLSTITG